MLTEQEIRGHGEHNDTPFAPLAPCEPPVYKLGYGLTRAACRNPKRTTKVIGMI